MGLDSKPWTYFDPRLIRIVHIFKSITHFWERSQSFTGVTYPFSDVGRVSAKVRIGRVFNGLWAINENSDRSSDRYIASIFMIAIVNSVE